MSRRTRRWRWPATSPWRRRRRCARSTSGPSRRTRRRPTRRPRHPAAELEKLAWTELEKLLGGEPLTDEELQRARNLWEATFVYGLEGMEGRADRLNQYFESFGDGGGFDRDRRRYVDATRES